jgi:hypothetical protein
VQLLLTGLRQDLYLPPLPFLRQEGAAVSATLFSPPPPSKSPVIVTTPNSLFGDALDAEDLLDLRAHRQVKALAGRPAAAVWQILTVNGDPFGCGPSYRTNGTSI